MRTFLLTLGMAFLFQLGLHAQISTIAEYDSISGGYLEFTLDNRMDKLLEEKESRCSMYTTVTKATPSKPANVTVVDMCRQYPKMSGVRIQVMNTRSSEDAEKAKMQILSQFPSLSADIEYMRPQFKLLVGDYFSRANAASDLNSIKRKYPGALLVASKIWCKRAK